MTSSTHRSPATRAEVVFGLIWGVGIRLLLIALAVYAVYRSRFVLITVLMAALLALLMTPLVDAICDMEWMRPQTLARRFMVTLIVFLFLFIAAGYSAYFLMVPFRDELRRLLETMDGRQGAIQGYMQEFNRWYQGLPPDVRAFLSGQIGTVGPRLAESLRVLLGSTLQWVAHVVELITIPVLAFYFVLDSKPLKREFLFLIPRRRSREAVVLLREAALILQTYALSQIILCVIAGVVVGAGLWLLDIRYALTLGVLAGVTRAIPILGPIIGGIPIVLVTALQSVQSAVAVLIFFSLLHLVESKIIMPKLLGDRMHLHPAIILIVLLIGAEFFGVLGMFLAAPFAALLKVFYDFYVLGHRRRIQLHSRPNKSIPREKYVQ